MKKIYLIIIPCLIVLSYFGTKLLTTANDYVVQQSIKNNKQEEETTNPDATVTPDSNNSSEQEEKNTSNKPKLYIFSDPITVMKGGNIIYDELIISATDEEDGDLKDKVTHNDIDTNTIGKQILTFTVTDSDGNTVSKDVVVTVEDEVIGSSEEDLTSGDTANN